MNKQQAVSAPPGASFVGKLWKGVYAVDATGRPLTLALVDDAGHVVEQGDAVSREVWNAALESYWKHLQDLGVMRVHAEPPGRHSPASKSDSASRS